MRPITTPTPSAPEAEPNEPEQQPSFALVARDDAIAHVVCCRAPSWQVAFCGEHSDAIVMEPTAVCTMCIEVIRARQPTMDILADPPICPDDGQPCPDEHEVDLRILDEVTT